MSDADPSPLARLVAAARENPSALIVVTGPTASGKSDLALAAAEALGAEIVGADSVQIVRHFDLGSGKPTPAECARVPHHLIDAVDPHDDIDASRFAAMAREAIADIERRGRRAIVTGGTYLWIRALVFGLVEAPPADEEVRREHRAFAEREGRPALHARLRAVDPASADRLHPNDVVRVSRALEVFETSGLRMSELQAAHGFRDAARDTRMFALQHSPEALTARIEARTRAWLAGGFVAEVEDLLARGYEGTRAMGSVGYREVAMHLRGELPASELEGAIVRATRLYARRQRTFLKQAPITWL